MTTDVIQQHRILIGTIHSICYDLLKTYLPDKYSDFEILSEDKQLHLIHSKLQNLGVPLTECNTKDGITQKSYPLSSMKLPMVV